MASIATRRYSRHEEATGLLRGDGKRQDGLSLVPWQGGRCLTQDATVVDTFTSSYISFTSFTPAAEATATRKMYKYSSISQTHFIPVVETMGPINADGQLFLDELGERLFSVSGDTRESSFSFQPLSVLEQRFNMVTFRVTFSSETDIGVYPLQTCF